MSYFYKSNNISKTHCIEISLREHCHIIAFTKRPTIN